MKRRAGVLGTRVLWILSFLGLSLLGCQQATEDPALAATRTKYTLVEEPSGALGVLELRGQLEQLAGQSVVVLGRVGTDESQTWEPGKAAFVITDPTAEMPEHDHGAGHDAENCPFCNAEAEKGPDPAALVQVVDEQGNVLPHDARKLFALAAGQMVVVRGKATVDGIGNLVLAAEAVYPRR